MVYIISSLPSQWLDFNSFNFTVLPHIIPFSLEEELNNGESAQLNCYISKGDKPLTINWHFNGEHISPNLGLTTMKLNDRSSVLMIGSATAANSGNYTCTVSNKAGSSSYTTSIIVHGRYLFLNGVGFCLLFLKFIFLFFNPLRHFSSPFCVFLFLSLYDSSYDFILLSHLTIIFIEFAAIYIL